MDTVTVTVTVTVTGYLFSRFMPDSLTNGLPVPAFWNSQQHLNLPLPMISLCTINRVGVSRAFLRVCACSATTSVLFVFLFTYALSCVLYSLNCMILFLLYTDTQIRLILFIYWSLPLLLDKILIIRC